MFRTVLPAAIAIAFVAAPDAAGLLARRRTARR